MTLKSLWELLWDYDPNGLLVVDHEMVIQVVNPAFCKMFQVESASVVGSPAAEVLDEVGDFQQVWQDGVELLSQEAAYPRYGLYVKKVIFPIPDQGLIACIFVDLTQERQNKADLDSLKRETIQQVHQVVDKQMATAQRIASLLGEATAETKVSLLKLLQMLEQEIG